MRILVTGAAGFIGFHTAARLLDRGERCVRPPRKHTSMIGIHGVDGTGESAAHQVLEQDSTHRAGPARSADERDRGRGQERAKVRGFVHAIRRGVDRSDRAARV